MCSADCQVAWLFLPATGTARRAELCILFATLAPNSGVPQGYASLKGRSFHSQLQTSDVTILQKAARFAVSKSHQGYAEIWKQALRLHFCSRLIDLWNHRFFLRNSPAATAGTASMAAAPPPVLPDPATTTAAQQISAKNKTQNSESSAKV